MARSSAPSSEAPAAEVPRGALDVDLLEACIAAALQTVETRQPEIVAKTGVAGLKLSLTHAVLEGARLFPDEPEKIVEFALRALPSFR
ncbi:hypothetical protein [Ancylobacter lacus]|uniref:hypothetical protein n=1 Tax=Ancylobacter lacus TaxID=2579970 RepID=UPI001BD18FB6|nr:hypothetical protein [Ancylobacter lacus]MBS7539097.1 hypothetical protein [Ancylobacter lacus]